jgi:hypothetical protein
MKIEDLAAIMGKSVPEVMEILRKQDVVQVTLKDDVKRNREERCDIILA